MRTSPRTLVAVALVWGAPVVSTASCAQEPIEAEVRSLERSGRVAFVCLGGPGAQPWRPLEDCKHANPPTPTDYSSPHLYALVTQTTRGEVAVIDVSSQTEPVLDQDTLVPGSSFLPVGAQPMDIVSTPGGTASFVGIAEIKRQGLFALPSTDIRHLSPDRGGARVRGIRPVDGVPPNTLSDWPACSLPSAPGSMLLVADPADDFGQVRATCDSSYEAVPSKPDPALAPVGLLAAEGQGALKLVVALPDEGGLAVVDAQDLLDRDAGSFDACKIERWIPLNVDWEPGVPPPPAQGEACVLPPEPAQPEVAGELRSRPGGLSFADGRLYVADLEAPVVHVIDMASPCSAAQRPSLQPRSAEDPSRVVTTSRVSVSPGLTPDGKRFLYAIDAFDGSVMVFDVSDDSGTATPLERPDAHVTPFSPRDRIKFASAARDVIILERDRAIAHPLTGVAQTGVRCDPDPSLKVCSGAADCDIETAYRTGAEYESGAGPYKLRGMFAFLVLSSGQVTIIDIDDYDAACRGPKVPASIYGCPAGEAPSAPLATSAEVSCNVVVPHSPRDAVYFLTSEQVGANQPGLQLFPLLYDEKGTLIPSTDERAPLMRALVPAPDDALPGGVQLTLAVGGNVNDISANGLIVTPEEIKQTLAMNLENPRAHVANQAWTVTYEGAIPGFSGKYAELRIDPAQFSIEDGTRGLFDPSSRFCDAGVQSQTAVAERLGVDVDDPKAKALADRVQIAAEYANQEHWYWDDPDGDCSYLKCSATFGTATVPTGINRDLRVLEAYQDHLVLAQSDGTDPDEQPITDALIKCCFPSEIIFNVRGGGQWVVVGDASGLLHHTIPDPATGACRTSCDPVAARLNGRVMHGSDLGNALDDEPKAVVDDPLDPRAFKNPMLRFAIGGGTPLRNYQFRFVTQGAFPTLLVDLTGDAGEVQPQAITFVPGKEQLAVTDGSLEGLILVNPDAVDVSNRFF